MISSRIKTMLFKKRDLVGLDIGSSSIKVAALSKKSKGYVLTDFDMIETPPDSLDSGEIVASGMVSDAISNLFQKAKIKTKWVTANIWGSAVIVKKITVPRMEGKLVAEQIRWEAEQYIPFDINEICLEFHVLSGGSSTETMDVILVAAKKDFVGNYSSTISSAGLECKILDVSNFALANCFEANYGVLSETVVLMNFGSRSTSFIVVENGNVLFSRDIPIGGMTISSDLHKELGVSLLEADSLRLSAVTGQSVPDEVQNVIQSSTEAIADEIQNSYDFFYATSANSSVSRCFITGGSAQVPGLIDRVVETTGVQFEEFDPFLRVGFEKKFKVEFIDQIRPFAAVAMGLAMREVSEL